MQPDAGWRITGVNPTAHHGIRQSAAIHRALMPRLIDPQRHAAHYLHAVFCQNPAEILCLLSSIRRTAARPDDCRGWFRIFWKRSTHKQPHRFIIDMHQALRICRLTAQNETYPLFLQLIVFFHALFEERNRFLQPLFHSLSEKGTYKRIQFLPII